MIGRLGRLLRRNRRLLLIAVYCACALVVLSIAALRLVGAGAAGGRAAAAPSATLSSAGAITAAPRTVSVIGDEWGASVGGTAWTTSLSSRLGVQVQTLIVPGGGYVTRGSGGVGTFGSQISQVRSDANVVVLFGGRHDDASTEQTVGSALSRALSELSSQAPSATIVVVGPVAPRDGAGRKLLAIRDEMRSVCALASVRWIDPIARGWLATEDGQYDTAEDLPSRQGELELADQMVNVVRPLIK